MQMNMPIGSLIRTLTPGLTGRQSIVVIICLFGAFMSSGVPLQAAKRPFTVADDIAVSRFGDGISWEDSFVFSPNHRFFAVYTEHGRLDLNRPESTLRVYRAEDITRILKEQPGAKEPSPLWEIRKSTYRHGPIVAR